MFVLRALASAAKHRHGRAGAARGLELAEDVVVSSLGAQTKHRLQLVKGKHRD